ncbi:MAG TPA: Hsp20/alpha crystallin family protein [Verrucomicrobiota bacterium]|nr:Hsp20/alpha crystallin family protein [Verrucomicrobiota bacterium]
MNTASKTETARTPARSEEHYVVPSVDITETKDEFVLEADMPGVTKNTLEVLLDGSELTIVGRRPAPKTREYLHRESNPAPFRRSFVLDPMIDAGRVTAQIDNGVLCVRLPKADEIKPRRISVTD